MISEKEIGCWIDGHWGIYASARLIDLALGYGMPDPDGTFGRAVWDGYTEDVVDLADEAENWLNEQAPEGLYFGWYDGEFYLWPLDKWEEFE